MTPCAGSSSRSRSSRWFRGRCPRFSQRRGEPWCRGTQGDRPYSERRAGDVSFAVVCPAGRMYGYRRTVQVPMASVIKAMFMTAYLRHPSVRDRPLHDSNRSLLGPMIKRSDNDAATRIADFLGPRRINRLARIARMQEFHYTRPWGLSLTSARSSELLLRTRALHPEAARGLRALPLVAHHRVTAWGIGQLNRPNS